MTETPAREVGGRAMRLDVADAIACVVTRHPHVDVDYLSIKPTDQATARDVHRR